MFTKPIFHRSYVQIDTYWNYWRELVQTHVLTTG